MINGNMLLSFFHILDLKAAFVQVKIVSNRHRLYKNINTAGMFKSILARKITPITSAANVKEMYRMMHCSLVTLQDPAQCSCSSVRSIGKHKAQEAWRNTRSPYASEVLQSIFPKQSVQGSSWTTGCGFNCSRALYCGHL